ncbi:hypothetical protein NPIL_438301, partial [Nephila pilipes]
FKKYYKNDNDSNRALEVEDEQDFDIFLSNKFFPTNITVTSPSTLNTRSNFINDCLNPEKIGYFADTRQRFPDLVQLSEELKASKLYNLSYHFPRITVQDLHKIVPM